MKIILSLLLVLSACKAGPQKDIASFKDIEPLQGYWVGTQVVLSNDDSTKSDYPSQLMVTPLKDSLELSMTNTYADAHQETEKAVLSIDKNGGILSLGASEYDIHDVIKTKDEFAITAFKEDEDNDRPADIRLKIIIRAGELTMLRDVRYKDTEKYFNRIHLTVIKK